MLSDILHACDCVVAQNEAKTTAIIYRCVKNDPTCLEKRNEFGATPLHLAVLSFQRYLVQLLLRFQVDKNATTTDNLHTPLHYAVRCGDVGIVEDLIKANANILARDAEGCTPLHWAAEAGHTEIAQLLLQHGASATMKNQYDELPCDMFLATSNPELFCLLS
mmetsp:Transcript_23591/g.30087  ORF Transcript_23591/g.30087 Transcript_23591/m.30087 type:complete len:163 (-) Transcript_23591:94-582(-)